MRFKLYKQIQPGDKLVLRIATAGLSKGSIVTVKHNFSSYIVVEEVPTPIDIRKVKTDEKS